MTAADTRSEKKPRIILLLQFYDPEPVYKGQKFAQAIAARGWDVEVVTGFPNYPGGKIYAGFKLKIIQRTMQNGIAVTRIPLYPSHDGSRLGRVANYISFFLSAFIYLTFFARKANLVYAYHPPLTVGLAAVAANIFRRAPVVVDIHDLWPDTLPATNMLSNPRLLGMIGGACKWMYRRTAHIIVHSNGFKQRLISRNVPADKITTVIGWGQENGSTQSDHQSAQEGNNSSSLADDTHLKILQGCSGLKVLFAGNIGRAQGLGAVIDAAALLKAQGAQEKVTFVFLGSGLALNDLVKKTEELNLNNVKFLPRVTPDAVSHYLDAADCLMVHLKDDPLFQITLPSKTQGYMIAGKPVLMAVGGEASELISSIGAGVTAKPEDPQSLAAAALNLAELSGPAREKMGAAGRAYYWDELCMENGINKFQSVFSKMKR